MKEPLVLLPGLMCDARQFAPLMAALSADTVVIVAPMTQGERIEEIASGLLPLLPHRFALAGAGMGGHVAMEILRRAADRVTRLALMTTSPLAETPQSSADYEPLIVGARSGRLPEMLARMVPATALAPGPERARVQAMLAEMGDALGPKVFVRQLRAMQRRVDQQAVLRRCKSATLVLCGAHDPVYPPRRHSFMAELIPNAELAVIDDAGHMPMLERPEAVLAAVRGWMARPQVPA